MSTVETERKSLRKIRDDTHYYPHQIVGVRDLARRGSFLLADEMGLGKTLQALTVAAIDFERGWANHILIVTPASLKWNWADEIEHFTHFSYMVLDGGPKGREEQLKEYAKGETDILIVNYEQVVAHLDTFNAMKLDICIYDEAHYLKSHKSKRAKACRAIKTDRNFLLTGSPLLNQVNELWSLLNMCDPHEYPNYWRFVNRYAVMGGYKDKQIVGVKNQAELQERVGKVMLRRLKKDCLDLPEKQHIIIKVDFHPDQAKIYKQAADEMLIDLPSNPDPMEIENGMTKFLRLKQICGTPKAIDATLPDVSHKLDRVVELVQEITSPDGDYKGEPVVLFTQFRGVQAAVVRRLQEAKPEPVLVWQLHGDVEKRERTEVVKAWGSAPKPGALVAMIQVAGVGLNMTQASKCIFIDKLFVPKLNEQAEDRLHRIGASTTQPIQIYEMIVKNSIEQRIETILRRKTKLFKTMIEKGDWKKALYEAMTEEDDG